MPRPPVLLALLAAGCAAGRPLQTAGPSPVRASLTESAADVLKAALADDGWAAETGDPARGGQSASHAGEEWDETTAVIQFIAGKPDREPGPLTTGEAAAVLREARAEIRRLVRAAGGEVLETAEGEAYRERWLTLVYKVDKTTGTVRARLTPASDVPEETANRLEVVVREQPAR